VIYQWLLESNQIEQMNEDAAVRPDYAPGAKVFSRDDWIELIHPEDREKVQWRISAALERGSESYQIEYRLRNQHSDYPMICETGWITRDQEGWARKVLCRITESNGHLSREGGREVAREVAREGNVGVSGADGFVRGSDAIQASKAGWNSSRNRRW